jgi:hypothetical protein
MVSITVSSVLRKSKCLYVITIHQTTGIKFLLSDAFNPNLVRNCKFYGLVKIGKLEPYFLEFHNLRMPVGPL